MKIKFSAALAAVLLATTALVSSSALAKSSPEGIAPSPAAGKLLAAAQKLIDAGDLKSAQDQLTAAKALSGRTPEDDYLIAAFQANIDIGEKNYADADLQYETLADSPVLAKDPGKATALKNAMILAVNVKHYAKVIQYGQQLEAMGPADAKVTAAMAEAYYFTNDYVHAKQYAQKSIDTAKAAGQQPDRGAIQIVMNSESSLHDEGAAQKSLEDLAVTYNDPDDWGKLILISLGTKGTELDALNMLRLGVAVGARLDSSDYSLMGDIALKRAFYGDAEAAARHGGKVAGVSAHVATDQRDLPGLVSAARNQDGKHNIVLAQDLYGYGRYGEAEELARRALSKGGDPNECNMVIGMSLAGQGKYSDAVAVFQQVGGGPASQRAAHLWLIYAQRKAAPPPAAATAPAPAPAH